MTQTRIYLPLNAAGAAPPRQRPCGLRLRGGGLRAFAVTEQVERDHPLGDEEEWEYAALAEACRRGHARCAAAPQPSASSRPPTSTRPGSRPAPGQPGGSAGLVAGAAVQGRRRSTSTRRPATTAWRTCSGTTPRSSTRSCACSEPATAPAYGNTAVVPARCAPDAWGRRGAGVLHGGDFATLQARLPMSGRANRVGSTTPHVVVVMPAFSLGEASSRHYATRLGAMEHRYLLAALMLPRIPGCEIVFVTCETPEPEVLEYYDRLASPGRRGWAAERLHVVAVETPAPRPVSAKLLDQPRPRAADAAADPSGGRPAMIEPWNVTDDRGRGGPGARAPAQRHRPGAVAAGLQERRAAGSSARSGVPTPVGARGRARPRRRGRGGGAHPSRAARGWPAVVVKHDNSGAGDGNVVVAVRDALGPPDRPGPTLVGALAGVVAAVVPRRTSRAGGGGRGAGGGPRRAQPQRPGRRPARTARSGCCRPTSRSSGATNGQVYSGCRFPADPAYAARLGEHAGPRWQRLADRGARGPARGRLPHRAAPRRVGRACAGGQPAQGRYDPSVHRAAPPRPRAVTTPRPASTDADDGAAPGATARRTASWTSAGAPCRRPASSTPLPRPGSSSTASTRHGCRAAHARAASRVDGRLGRDGDRHGPGRGRAAVCRDRAGRWPPCRRPDRLRRARPARGRPARGRPRAGRAARSAPPPRRPRGPGGGCRARGRGARTSE